MAKSRKRPAERESDFSALTAPLWSNVDPKKVTKGPYLANAVFVEKILHEKDNSVSLIRIVDKIGVPSEPVASIPKGTWINIPIILYVSLKNGEFKGEAFIMVLITSPTGEQVPAGLQAVNFGTADRTHLVLNPVSFPWHGAGEYLVDIFIGNEFCTRTSLIIEVPDQRAK